MISTQYWSQLRYNGMGETDDYRSAYKQEYYLFCVSIILSSGHSNEQKASLLALRNDLFCNLPGEESPVENSWPYITTHLGKKPNCRQDIGIPSCPG